MSGGTQRSTPPPTPEPAVPPLSWVEPAAFIAVGCYGVVALSFILKADPVSALALLAVYLSTLFALASILIFTRRAGRDCTIPLLVLLAATCLGPIAAFGGFGLALGDRRRTGPGALLDAWYDRISAAAAVGPDERLCESVSTGRTLNLAGPLPRSFPSLMDHGPIADRQMILGHIARNFHPAYIETLTGALGSAEPVVRVQAAAVAAHLAPTLRRRLTEALDRAGRQVASPLECLRLVDELGSLARSGLLDAHDRLRAEAELRRLGDTILDAVEAGEIQIRSADQRIDYAEIEPALERLLVERGRMAALRKHRRYRRISASHPTARLRRLRAKVPREAAA